MKNVSALILSILILSNSSQFAQSGWSALSSGTTLNIRDIQFLDNNTGYFVANEIISSSSIVRKSVNGGSTWSTIFSVNYYNRLYFVDQNTGTVVGSLGAIHRTTNGGATWVTQTSPAGANALFGVKFIDANTGFIAGDFRTVLFTTDGGTTWVNRPFGGGDRQWRDVHFFDANTGLVIGSLPFSAIAKTTDAGLNWEYLNGSFADLYSIAFANNSIGFCADGRIIKTTNNGNNWFSIYQPPSGQGYYDLSVIDINNIVVVGGGGTFGGKGIIARTSNSGLNWIEQAYNSGKRLWGVSFINSNTGWACGDTGTLVKTTTGGITPIQTISSEIPKSFSLEQNYPNPFNPATKIKFNIPVENGSDRSVKLIIYDAIGREIAVLLNEELNPGVYEIEWGASAFPSGMYFYELKTESFRDVKKMVLIK